VTRFSRLKTGRIHNSNEMIRIKCASSLNLIINDSNEEDSICNLAYRIMEKLSNTAKGSTRSTFIT
jgi:hypothetical protein